MSVRALVKTTIGLVGPAAAIIGTLLGLGVIHPFGGDGSALAAAAGRTDGAGTAAGSLTVRVLAGGTELRRVTGDGAFDFRKGEFREVLETRSSSASGRTELIYAPPLLYQRVTPERLQPLPGGKQWLAVDLDALHVANASSEFGILGFGENDPSQFLEYLRSAGSVKKVGQERIFGVVTTHYTADLDPAKMRALSAPGKRGPTGATTGPLPHEDAWIDAGGLLRRIGVDFRVGSLEFVETLDFSNFGTAVNVTSPPAGHTADLAALIKGKLPPALTPASPNEGVSAPIWVKRANGVCVRTLGAEHRLRQPSDPALLPPWIRLQIAIAERGTRELAALGRPAGKELQAARLVRTSAREADVVKTFLLAADFGTDEDLRRIEQRAGALDEQFNRIALALGARVCAESA